jgi:glycosyltransferase involved in cell wall biosynthesis
MRCLVVAQDFPWPVSIGSHLRLAQVIEVAAGLGPTDLFAFVPARRREPCVLPDERQDLRLKTVIRPRPSLSPGGRLRWLTTSRLPLELVADHPREPRRQFEAWRAEHYDVVWFSKAATFELLGRPRLGPTVVDLDDLEDRKILSRLAAVEADEAGPRTAPHPRGGIRSVQATMNAARWARLQRSVSGAVERVALCSDLDATRSGLANVAVIPNGYDAPAHPVGRPAVADPPTLLLAGNYLYPPNADAAGFLVTEILPLLGQHVGPVRIRLVGEPNESVDALGRPPEVSVVGHVASMEPELARADVVVVPVRYGSGTRVKILEAAAQRIPVVSTTLGAEGLGFEDGRHLLVADTAAAFAAACGRLLRDPELRARLVDEAEREFLARFQWSSVRAQIRELVLDVAGVASP